MGNIKLRPYQYSAPSGADGYGSPTAGTCIFVPIFLFNFSIKYADNFGDSFSAH